jgi:beta-mannosidase
MTNIRLLFLSVILPLCLVACNQERPATDRPLAINWEFKKSSDTVWLSARVPGSVQQDLLRNDIIPDPFVSTNADSIVWVETENWDYRGTFKVTEQELKHDHLELVFGGLDTHAEVYLNGTLIVQTDNMFRSYTAAVDNLIKSGENELTISFTSPWNRNVNKIKSLPYKLPSGSEPANRPISSFTRKAAYQFGWDFAPRIVTMGIWRPITIRYWSEAKINSVQFIPIEINPEVAQYTIKVQVESGRNQDILLKINGVETHHKTLKGVNVLEAELIIENPEYWWPNGLGNAKLYHIPIEIYGSKVRLDKVEERIGVRTIELVQNKDAIGESFFFNINGKHVFMKGANWSPLSSFPASIEDSVYTNRIMAVKDANMNMLRVWGGGIYESDLFYDLCDANGILVWQDFMFANSMYPPDTSLFRNMEEEVKDQIIRLRNHASIAHWNGNNEIEVAWENWGWQDQLGYSTVDSAEIWHNYQSIFQDRIPKIITELDPVRSYTTTSPLSNWGKPQNFNSGTMHYWGVWHGQDRFTDFSNNVGRFMAEYGFQSYPSPSTFNLYADGGDIFTSSNQALHQLSYVGNSLIYQEIEHYLGKANTTNDFINKSQLTQAIALKMAIEAHRLATDKCGGTLFWQLNDVWPGPSWSIIDYHGNKKIGYEVVKDRFKPTIIIPVEEANNFSIYIANDQPIAIDAQLKIEMFKVTDERVWVLKKPLNIGPNQTSAVFKSARTKLLDGMPDDEVYLKITLEADSTMLDIENYYFMLPKNYRGRIDLVGEN